MRLQVTAVGVVLEVIIHAWFVSVLTAKSPIEKKEFRWSTAAGFDPVKMFFFTV
jgi:hypothetical protein